MKKYNPKQIEGKWQRYWEKHKTFKTPERPKKKQYVLDMLPYISAAGLHVGHPEGYTATDIISRYLRMNGYDVLHPMGWDAFGLPTENYAIQTGIHPAITTKKGIDRFRKQIKALGLSYDWDREVNTSDPNYYKWTQWLFLLLYKNGLAYKKEANVNWCLKDNTVLANEQVINGRCERCGTEVEQKLLSQWFFKTTAYAERLLSGLENLDWPEPIKTMQRNWIGKSEGAEIDFKISAESNIKRFILIPGRGGSPDRNFIPSLKVHLEKAGYEVIAPAMPNPVEVNDIEQRDFIIKNFKPDEQTAIVGHSFGGVVALRILEQGVKLGKVFLVGTVYSGKFLDDKKRASVKTAVEKGFDFEKIKNHCRDFVAIYDTHDYVVPMSDGESFAKNLAINLIKIKAQKGHFSALDEPELVNEIVPNIKVFTTRPDTIFGATYMVLAPEHPLVASLMNHESGIMNQDEVRKYIEKAKKKTELQRTALEKDKTGVELKGVKAVNPATGEEIPIWVADYVMSTYGTGAIMAVPAHDERDFEFAKKYKLPIKQVIAPETGIMRDKEEINKGSCALIFNLKTQKYAVAKLQSGLYWFYGGSREVGEDPKKAVLREVTEESGFYDFAHVEFVGSAYTHHHNALRKVNRISDVSYFLVVLRSSMTKDLKLEKHEKFELIWVSAKEILENLTKYNQEKDYEHWIEFLKQGVGRATELGYDKTSNSTMFKTSAFVGSGIIMNSDKFDGLKSDEAIVKMGKEFGVPKVQYKLRDWLVSRQRYWGAPIPIIYCEKCALQDPSGQGMQPVPEKDLPVKLPTDVDFLPTGESPLTRSKSFHKVKCPNCKGPARRDSDTMDTFVDSAWYFYRYVDPKNNKEFVAKKKIKDWLPVDTYVGGAEHAVLHLLYSRFLTKVLFDLKHVNFEEPFKKLRNQGLILGPDGEKMSKSRGNVINPDDIINEFGADSLRMYEMFMGPLEDAKPWNTNGLIGLKRFLDRVWKWVMKAKSEKRKAKSDFAIRKLNLLIKKISEDIENFRFNTAVSAFMQFYNEVKDEPVSVATMKTFLILLYPFAPHVTEELNEKIDGKKSLQLESWPKFDPKKIAVATVTIIIQINGKVKDKFVLPTGSSEDAVKNAALGQDKVKQAVAGQTIKRVIYVPDRLINFVV